MEGGRKHKESEKESRNDRLRRGKTKINFLRGTKKNELFGERAKKYPMTFRERNKKKDKNDSLERRKTRTNLILWRETDRQIEMKRERKKRTTNDFWEKE